MNEYLRAATKEDCDLLFEWANDNDVRRNSFTKEKISYKEHQKWFQSKQQNNSCKHYIYIVNEIPVGQVRLDICDKAAEISYSIAKSWRGQGYGKKMLFLLFQKISEEHLELVTFIGKVKVDNKASKEVFMANGFIPKYITYEKNI